MPNDSKRRASMALYNRRVAQHVCVECCKPLGNSSCKRCGECRYKNTIGARRRIAAGVCKDCGGPREDMSKLCCAKCNSLRAENRRQRTRKLRYAVLRHYAGGAPRCGCCGESIPQMLTLDHVAGGGSEHRRQLGDKSAGSHFYTWLRTNGYPTGYQVLCWNCNSGRAHNYGICPHRTYGRKFQVKLPDGKFEMVSWSEIYRFCSAGVEIRSIGAGGKTEAWVFSDGLFFPKTGH